MEQDISGPSMKAGHLARQKNVFYFTSLLLTQQYHSPGTINKFPFDHYIASRKGRNHFLHINKVHVMCFSLHNLSYQIGAQIQPKPHIVKKKNPTKPVQGSVAKVNIHPLVDETKTLFDNI